MNLHTLASRAAAGVVAAVAGFASYQHIYRVATTAGEHTSVAAVLPLAIDGLILVGTLALLEDKRHDRHPRMSARVALVFGIAATIAANVASAQPTITARLVAAVPAVSFLLAVEVMARVGRPRREPAQTADPEPVVVEREPAPEPVREPVQRVKREPARKRVKAQSLTAADQVMAAHLQEPDATHARIAELSGVSLATVKRYRPAKPENGSPTDDLPGQMPLTEPVNGHRSELVEVTR